jgi:imidazolonepropionase-like amidohydrolase
MVLRTLLILAVAFSQNNVYHQLNSRIYELKNGKWFDGNQFKKAIWYSVNGKLSNIKPQRIDSTIDLNNGFVIPPFGEAHNHNVNYTDQFPALSAKYLNHGIFYVKVPNNFLEGRNKLITNDLINKDTTIDAIFANGGITSYKGHPYFIVQRNIENGFMTEKEGEGDFYNTVMSVNELSAKWPEIMEHHPDFIKTYLLFSEEYNKRNSDSNYIGQRGLDPALLAHIVKKAHQAGLRVSVHVETAIDFHSAITAGVDEVNHMPGFRGDPMQQSLNGLRELKYPLKIFQVDKKDAMLAAQKGIVVVTTLSGILQVKSTEDKRIADSLFKINLQTLKEAGVKIALGSDAYRGDSWDEVEYLMTTGVFSNLEMLRMFSVITPKTIFPERKIAQFKNGYEASFLVVKNDPLIDIMNAKDIYFSVKQGTVLINTYK